MRHLIDRRRFVLGSLAMIAAPIAARAEGLVIRPDIGAVDPRYRHLVLDGPFSVPASPFETETSAGRLMVVAPSNADRAHPVVFSSNVLTEPRSYRHLFRHWASHGFAVVAPYHDDAATASGGSMREWNASGVSDWRIDRLAEDPDAWARRIEQCSDALSQLRDLSAGLGLELEEGAAIAGHGFGSFCAQVLAGARPSGAYASLATDDPSPFACSILLAPVGAGVLGLEPNSWVGMRRPMLSIISEGEPDFLSQPPEALRSAFEGMEPGWKHLGIIRDGGATVFTPPSTQLAPEQARRAEAVRGMSTAFLSAYLRRDEAAFADMTNDLFARMSMGLVGEERR